MSTRMNRRDGLKRGIAGAGGVALYKGLETWRLLPALGDGRPHDRRPCLAGPQRHSTRTVVNHRTSPFFYLTETGGGLTFQ